MDIALGLMLTATGLFQAVESPLGQVASFGQDDGAQGPIADDIRGTRATMIESIAESFKAFERQEILRGKDARPQLYRAMRKIAAYADKRKQVPEREEE